MGDHHERKFDLDAAIQYYKDASENFSLEKHHSTSSNKCLLKAAELSSFMFDDPDRLKDAIKIYDEIAKEYLRNNLMRFSAKTLFIKATMIYFLLEDDVGAEKALNEYSMEDSSLNNSTEYRFIRKVIQAMRDGNKENYEIECSELNKRMTLDKWWLKVLAKIKTLIKGNDNVIEDFNPL
jgi:hypothetical protein